MPMVHSSRRKNFSFMLALVAVGLLLAIALPSATLATSRPAAGGYRTAAAAAAAESGERRDGGSAAAAAADSGERRDGADAGADVGMGNGGMDADADARYGWRDGGYESLVIPQ